MFLDNENYKLLLIIPCKIENGIEYLGLYSHNFGENKNIFFKVSELHKDLFHINQEIWA